MKSSCLNEIPIHNIIGDSIPFNLQEIPTQKLAYSVGSIQL